MDAAKLPMVYLKPRRAKPFFMRHPWVFSGAIGRIEGSPTKGSVVAVADDRGTFIGKGLFNPDSQIIVRLLTWERDEAVDAAFWRRRIERAVRLRRDVLDLSATQAYRVIFSESDGLSGLIVDKYGDYLVAQFLSAGMTAHREPILDCLTELLQPRGILHHGDDETAEKEAIAMPRGILRGEAPSGPLEVAVDGMRFLVDLAGGQKTGFFLDQRENRLAAAHYLRGRAVLDAFCYTGAFGITAIKAGGATELLAVDRSAPALELAQRNFELNGITNAQAHPAQIADELRTLKKAGRTFGGIILDPPKFSRSAAGMERALRAYRDLNLLAMQLLQDDGILVTCSCSGHVSPEMFLMMLNDAATEAGVTLQILERRGQSADHPVIASCPETGYLKCFIGRVAK